MTDADKLRRIGLALRDKEALLFENAPLYIKQLECCADLLDAVPPETLKAIKAGTWKAVPVEPTNTMAFVGMRAGREALSDNPEEIIKVEYRAAIAAAPAKPEGGG